MPVLGSFGFVPQGSMDLANWTTNNFSPALVSDLWQLALPKTNSAQFFRLRR